MITIGSLFSGIGGLELGIEAALSDAGLSPVVRWQVEIEDYPRQVLARHWPGADRSVQDVRLAGAATLPPVVVLIGGFPCTDLSQASHGWGRGLDGEHSGLWWEFVRIIRELRPSIVVVENVTQLVRDLGAVLGPLAALGYDAEWDCLSACAVGAPHVRDRLFVVAYTDGHREPVVPVDGEAPGLQAHAALAGVGWDAPPMGDRVVDGVPGGLDATRALGRAVVPAVARVVGQRVAARLLARSPAPEAARGEG